MLISRLALLLGGLCPLLGCTSVLGWNELTFGETSPGIVVKCVPKTCAELSASCGAAADGCGQTILCGLCPEGQQCGGGGTNVCGDRPCTPVTCEEAAVCGVVSDGCASTIDCAGQCTSPCASCQSLAASCGVVDDGCGAELNCGNCTPPKVCQDNECKESDSCTTCEEQGAECGVLSDGCGKDLDCGTCSSGTCSNHKCNCTPKTCAELSADCGSISDGCGKNISCGNCNGTESCGGGGKPNKCGGGDDSAAQYCVDTINQYRATVGRAPLKRWTEKESCSDGEAKNDSQTHAAHGSFGNCGEWAQNECPGWPGPLKNMLAGCLQMMWDEGPGGGHYENMQNPQYNYVACGFSAASGNDIWSVQNFK